MMFDWWFAPPPDSGPAFHDYYRVRVWSTPFVLVNFVVLGWFYGRARATVGMLLQLSVNLVNVALSIFFVAILGYGVAGVALATVVGHAVAATLGGWLVLHNYGGITAILKALPFASLTEINGLRRMVASSRDLTLRSLALTVSLAYFVSHAGREGDVDLAATGILLQIIGFANFLLDGPAVEQLSGRAVGANWLPASSARSG